MALITNGLNYLYYNGIYIIRVDLKYFASDLYLSSSIRQCWPKWRQAIHQDFILGAGFTQNKEKKLSRNRLPYRFESQLPEHKDKNIPYCMYM